MLFGFALLTHAANLSILVASGDPTNRVTPIVTEAGLSYADPLPQALLLTAIVIGFGVGAYLIVLLYRLYLNEKRTDLSAILKDDTDD